MEGKAELKAEQILAEHTAVIPSLAQRFPKLIRQTVPEAQELAYPSSRAVGCRHREVGYFCGILPTRAHQGSLVSMLCWEAFEAESEEYRESVIPPSVAARVSVEAGSTFGWSRWIGERGIAIGLDRFGASAPGATNIEKFGFTAEKVAEAVRSLLRRGRAS